MTSRSKELETIPEVTPAEREVADLLAIGASAEEARRVRDSVPLWFHTFNLNHSVDLYTPGIARDHRYRIPGLPDDLTGQRVLDVGAFDGFYSFLAEARGAERVVAADNEQYVEWVRARFGVELEGGAGFRAIARLLGSKVEYRRIDAFDLDQLEERFDVVFCFGILHRVESPLGLLRVLARRLVPGGRLLLETYGSAEPADSATIDVQQRGAVYARDDFVYWGFTPESVRRLGAVVGLGELELIDAPLVDGHPRLIGALTVVDGD